MKNLIAKIKEHLNDPWVGYDTYIMAFVLVGTLLIPIVHSFRDTKTDVVSNNKCNSHKRR